MNTASSLLQFSIFQGLESQPEALKFLETLFKPESFKVRDYLVDERNPEPKLYLLMSGQVVIQKKDAQGLLVVIGKAEATTHPVLGEGTLLGRFKKSADVVAHTPCQCLTLAAKDFDVFLQKYPYAAASIYKSIATLLFDRLTKSNNDLMIQGLLSKSS